MKYLITLEVESEWTLENLVRGQHGALIFGANHPWKVLEAKEDGQVMKTKEEIELEIEKVIVEMQEINEEDEAWDVRNGWVNALRWIIKEEVK